jgi:hypothetical protein
MKRFLLTTTAFLTLSLPVMAEDFMCRINSNTGHLNVYVFTDRSGDIIFERSYQKDEEPVVMASDPSLRPIWVIQNHTLIQRDNPSYQIHTARTGAVLTHNNNIVGTGTCDYVSNFPPPVEATPPAAQPAAPPPAPVAQAQTGSQAGSSSNSSVTIIVPPAPTPAPPPPVAAPAPAPFVPPPAPVATPDPTPTPATIDWWHWDELLKECVNDMIPQERFNVLRDHIHDHSSNIRLNYSANDREEFVSAKISNNDDTLMVFYHSHHNEEGSVVSGKEFCEYIERSVPYEGKLH